MINYGRKNQSRYLVTISINSDTKHFCRGKSHEKTLFSFLDKNLFYFFMYFEIHKITTIWMLRVQKMDLTYYLHPKQYVLFQTHFRYLK